MQLQFQIISLFPHFLPISKIALPNGVHLLLSSDNQLYYYDPTDEYMFHLKNIKVLKMICAEDYVALLFEQSNRIGIVSKTLLKSLIKPIIPVLIVPPGNSRLIDFVCVPHCNRVYTICEHTNEIFVYSYPSPHKTNEINFFNSRIPLPQQPICIANDDNSLFVGFPNYQCAIINEEIKPYSSIYTLQLLSPRQDTPIIKPLHQGILLVYEDLLLFLVNNYLMLWNIQSKQFYRTIKLPCQNVLNISVESLTNGILNCLLQTAPFREMLSLVCNLNGTGIMLKKEEVGYPHIISFNSEVKSFYNRNKKLYNDLLKILLNLTENNPFLMNCFEEYNIADDFRVLQILVLNAKFQNEELFLHIFLINSDCSDLIQHLGDHGTPYPSLRYQTLPAVFRITADLKEIQSFCTRETNVFHESLGTALKNKYNIPPIIK